MTLHLEEDPNHNGYLSLRKLELHLKAQVQTAASQRVLLHHLCVVCHKVYSHNTSQPQDINFLEDSGLLRKISPEAVRNN